MAFIDFTNGEVLTADQMDTVMRQSVMRFADATARDTALSAVLAEGMMCYLDDTNEVLKYDGSSWGAVSETVDSIITTQGDLVIGDASGNAVRLPVGSANQVLTSDGTTASFEDLEAGGGMTLISSNALSGLTTLTITSLPTDYTRILILGLGLRSGLSYQAAIKTTRGSNVVNNTHDYVRINGQDGTVEQITGGTSGIETKNNAGANDGTHGFSFIFDDYTDTSLSTFTGTQTYFTGSTIQSETFGGQAGPFAITGFQITTNNSNFTNGTVEVWGIK